MDMPMSTGVLERGKKNITIRRLLLQLRAFIALIILFTFFAAYSDGFLNENNLIILTKQVAINAILGIGMTFVILTSGIDLSVGSIVGLCGMVAGALISQGLRIQALDAVVYFTFWPLVMIVLIVGMIIGLVNGILITRFNVAPFIATLGTLYIARGLAMLMNNGATFTNFADPKLGEPAFVKLGSEKLLALPYSIWIMAVMGVIAVFLTMKTPFGRQIFAIGGNKRAAQLSGVRVKSVTMLTYVISGLCSGMVGLIIASQLRASHPATGEGYELNAIAAVVLGGTSLSGGRGAIGGTIIGAFVIGVLNNGMTLENVSSFWQQVITGIVIILAVIIDQVQQRLQERNMV